MAFDEVKAPAEVHERDRVAQVDGRRAWRGRLFDETIERLRRVRAEPVADPQPIVAHVVAIEVAELKRNERQQQHGGCPRASAGLPQRVDACRREQRDARQQHRGARDVERFGDEGARQRGDDEQRQDEGPALRHRPHPEHVVHARQREDERRNEEHARLRRGIDRRDVAANEQESRVEVVEIDAHPLDDTRPASERDYPFDRGGAVRIVDFVPPGEGVEGTRMPRQPDGKRHEQRREPDGGCGRSGNRAVTIVRHEGGERQRKADGHHQQRAEVGVDADAQDDACGEQPPRTHLAGRQHAHQPCEDERGQVQVVAGEAAHHEMRGRQRQQRSGNDRDRRATAHPSRQHVHEDDVQRGDQRRRQPQRRRRQRQYHQPRRGCVDQERVEPEIEAVEADQEVQRQQPAVEIAARFRDRLRVQAEEDFVLVQSRRRIREERRVERERQTAKQGRRGPAPGVGMRHG